MIFSIIFHVLTTQSAAINVKYVLFVVLQLLVLLTLGCCEIWVHHIPLLESKQDNLPIPVKYSKLALLYIWNVKEKNAWCEDFFVGVRPKWEVSQESWCFPRQSRGKHQDSRENKTNWFPEGPDFKCFVIFPDFHFNVLRQQQKNTLKTGESKQYDSVLMRTQI